jgi:hypothetical protein
MRPRAADHGERPGPVRAEARQLLGVQLTDPGPVKITLCGHTWMLDRGGVVCRRRATVSARLGKQAAGAELPLMLGRHDLVRLKMIGIHIVHGAGHME